MKQQDLLIGRLGSDYLKFPGYEHVICYARPRSGKTSGWVIPNAFAWRGSLVCLDVRGEIFAATAGHREAMGQEVFVFNPATPDMRTHRWNPLAAIDRTSPDRFDMIRRQSYALFPDAMASSNTASSSNAAAFWIPAGRSAFEGVTALVAETPDLPMTMETVLRLFTVADSQERLARLIEARRKANNPYSRVVVDQISDFCRGAQEQVEGIRKTVTTAISPWFSPRVQAATEVSDFDLRDIRRKPMSIYLTIAPGDIPRMRPVLALFFEQLVMLNSDVMPKDDPTIKWQALLLLDEFLRLGRMPDVAEAGQYLGGYGVRMAIVVQDKFQLSAKYGTDAMKDIFSNVGAEIVFGVSDKETTEELSARMGFNTVPVQTQNRPRFWAFFNWSRQSVSEHPNKRSLMLPQEIARMSPDEQIVLRTGMMPIKCQRMKWYEDENFTSLRRLPPEPPQITVKIPLDDGVTPIPRPIQRGGVRAVEVQYP